MKVLVTGSSGHLGEALVRSLQVSQEHEVTGIDVVESEFTQMVGSIKDRSFVHQAMTRNGIEAIIHTAALQKPHVETHSRQQFVDTNITGTLNLLEEAAEQGVKIFVYTSTTSLFGDAMKSRLGDPAIWINEQVVPQPKNIYGVTKLAAENLCQLFHRLHDMNCIILRTSRFFQEADDQSALRDQYQDQNLKANEFLYRRVDIADIVNAHLLAIDKASQIGFDKFIISATTPFTEDDLDELGKDAPQVVAQIYPSYQQIYTKLEWRMFSTLDRVYCNNHARELLGWEPRYDFEYWVKCLQAGDDPRSDMCKIIKYRGYHGEEFLASNDVYPALQTET